MEVDSAILYVLVLTFSFLCPCVRGNLFEEVESCPKNEQEWNERARKKKCTQALPDFMCAAIENKPGRFGEICSIVGLSAKGYCAVLDEDTYNLNYIKCLAASGCPETEYRSSEVYRYKACYFSEPSTTPTFTGNVDNTARNHSAEKIRSFNAVTFSTFVIYIFTCILVILVISIYWYKRNQSKRRRDMSEMEERSTEQTMPKEKGLEGYLTEKTKLIENEMEERSTEETFPKGTGLEGNLTENTKLIENDVKIMTENAVESGVVVTQGIKDIMKKMESKKVVICHGAIGCGKSTALDYVTKKYREKGWIIEGMEECFDESCTERLFQRDIEKTVICIDNLFGSFGCLVFFDKTFIKFKQFMRQVAIWEKKPIVLLGIHQHVYDEISPQHDPFPPDKSLFVDLNMISDSEALQIYTLQREKNKKTHCEISIEDFCHMIEHRSNEVGTPFQTLMISAAPGVFGNKLFCSQPFQILTAYFDHLQIKERDVFCSLLYIMCVTFFDPSEDKLNLDVAKAISDSLNTKTITHHLSRLTPYTHDDGNVIEIKHDLIAIALFHVLMRKSDNLSVLKVYDIRRILELVRLGGQNSRLHQFAVPVKADVISLLKKRGVNIDIRSDMSSKCFS